MANRYKPEGPLVEGEIGDLRPRIALPPAGGAILEAPPWRPRMMVGRNRDLPPIAPPRRWPGRKIQHSLTLQTR